MEKPNKYSDETYKRAMMWGKHSHDRKVFQNLLDRITYLEEILISKQIKPHTYNLLEKYLKQYISKIDVNLTDYTLNGSIIKIRYSYQSTYSSGEVTNISNEIGIDLLDYITFVYSLCNDNK